MTLLKTIKVKAVSCKLSCHISQQKLHWRPYRKAYGKYDYLKRAYYIFSLSSECTSLHCCAPTSLMSRHKARLYSKHTRLYSMREESAYDCSLRAFQAHRNVQVEIRSAHSNSSLLWYPGCEELVAIRYELIQVSQSSQQSSHLTCERHPNHISDCRYSEGHWCTECESIIQNT
ncbi:unnamed protein product [Albugo candida]|uniref:Uncharacterized protein n=1 Tax=Albugo candida TaxID=65357 RepID=A0A024G4J7_9STRA|nr:unnamed protein product [Albugo candida]|eukprot:CCI41597.1 unnamed protein product [Albugo candida]